MAPIKLEEHIREKLQEREIQPSEAAWSKLESQLGDSDRKSPFIWYAIAASFIGIIIVASFVFTKDNSTANFADENTTEKVEAEIPSEINKNQDAVEQITIIPSEDVAVETSLEEKKESLTPVVKKQVKTLFQKKIGPKQAIALTEPPKAQNKIKEEKINTAINSNMILENLKIEEVVAQVKSIQNSNPALTEDDIDALLLNAQRELQTERILNNPKVDVMALLQDVEFEMERSFRDKVFDALGENFTKIRTAVSNRNN